MKLRCTVWLRVGARADLPGPRCHTAPLAPVQKSVDGIERGHGVSCKQAGPPHRLHHPLHAAAHEGHEHRGVVGEQQQASAQLAEVVDNQFHS